MASNPNQNNPGPLASSTASFSSLPSNVKYTFVVDDSDDDNVVFTARENNDPPKGCEFLDIDDDDSGEEGLPFDYHGDHLEFKYKEEMKIFEFIINQVHLHYSDSSPFSIPSEPNNLPNDEEIKKGFEEHHGPMDFESTEENQKLFKNLKKEMICEYQRWIKSANEILQEIQSQSKSKVKNKFYLESVLGQINQEMSPIKPRYLRKREEDWKQSPNVLKSGIEPYDLPRPAPAQFIKDSIEKLQKEMIEQQGSTTQVSGDDSVKKEDHPFNQLNLAFFDPIVDKFDRITFTKSLQFPLVKSILKVLKRFPLGISPKVLYEEFEKEHHYKIDYITLGFSSFEELLTDNNSVFSLFKSDMCNLNLVFSAFLEVNPNIDAIQKKICHWILIMLQMSEKPVQVSKATETLNGMFNVGLNVKAYGLTEEVYYRTIVGFWAPNRVQFFKCPSPSDLAESAKLSLFMKLTPSPGCNPNDESFEKYSEGSSAAYAFHMLDAKSQQEFLMKFHFKDSSIFIGFELPAVSDFLNPGLKYKVKPDLLIDPMDCYVCLQSQLSERNAFVSVMTEFYEDKANSRSLVIKDSGFLHPGIFIAVKFEDEWHRGKIIKSVTVAGKKELFYKVYMVDRGVFSQSSKLKEMRYLDNTFATFPMQSIPVRLRRSELQQTFGKNYVRAAKWDDDIRDFFYSFLIGKVFMIIPVSRSSMDSWEVDLHIIGESNVFKPDLMDTMKKYFNG